MVFRIGRIPDSYENPAFASEAPPVPLGFSTDGTGFCMNMTHRSDRHGIYRVRQADGLVPGAVWTDPEFDVFAILVRDPDSGLPVGVHYMRHHPQTGWFDPGLRRLSARLEAVVPGQHDELVSVDERKHLYLFHS